VPADERSLDIIFPRFGRISGPCRRSATRERVGAR
jgi:hypothetical protein